jgi:hypothetical protein
MGLLTIGAFPIIAYAIEVCWYELATGEFRHRDIETVVIISFYLLAPLAAAAIWYPIGFLLSRVIRRGTG